MSWTWRKGLRAESRGCSKVKIYYFDGWLWKKMLFLMPEFSGPNSILLCSKSKHMNHWLTIHMTEYWMKCWSFESAWFMPKNWWIISFSRLRLQESHYHLPGREKIFFFSIIFTIFSGLFSTIFKLFSCSINWPAEWYLIPVNEIQMRMIQLCYQVLPLAN